MFPLPTGEPALVLLCGTGGVYLCAEWLLSNQPSLLDDARLFYFFLQSSVAFALHILVTVCLSGMCYCCCLFTPVTAES